jgi:hypothetical protein
MKNSVLALALCLLSGPVMAEGLTCTSMLEQQAATAERVNSSLQQLAVEQPRGAGDAVSSKVKLATEIEQDTAASLERLSELQARGCLERRETDIYAEVYLRTLESLTPLLNGAV